MSVNAERKAAILERSAGRKLRPDEKVKLNGPPLLLAKPYDGQDVTGWWASEKLDGIRALWNGNDFVSRAGNVFKAPDGFKPNTQAQLDGELYMGRGKFQETASVIRHDDWSGVKYMVFDIPSYSHVSFETRQEALRGRFAVGDFPMHFGLVEQHQVFSEAAVVSYMNEIVRLGGEGVMLREPGSVYVGKRSSTLLKMKPFKDAEAVVVTHEPGKGKHAKKMGALVVRMPNGNVFNLGTGFTDEERSAPPAVGTTVTYRYTELTDDGLPKCASFVRIRPEGA